MHELYELKEMLCKELEEYGSKGELSAGSLDVVDKLAHAAKNVGKIIEMCEEDEEYSGRTMPMYGGYYADGRSYDGRGGSYARDGRRSYARGGRSYARRDSMGRYSRAEMNEMVSELRELMEDAPDERTKKEFQKFITKIEGM